MKTAVNLFNPRILAAFGLFILLSFSGFTQKGSRSFGVEYSKRALDRHNFDFIQSGNSFGAYYDMQFGRRLGLSTGLYLDRFSYTYGGPCVGDCPRRTVSSHFITVPVNLMINLDYYEDSRQKGFLILGYALGLSTERLSSREMFINSIEPDEILYRVNFGLQFKHQVKTKYEISWGVVYEHYWASRHYVFNNWLGSGKAFLRLGKKRFKNNSIK